MNLAHPRRECGCYPDPGTPPEEWKRFLWAARSTEPWSIISGRLLSRLLHRRARGDQRRVYGLPGLHRLPPAPPEELPQTLEERAVSARPGSPPGGVCGPGRRPGLRRWPGSGCPRRKSGTWRRKGPMDGPGLGAMSSIRLGATAMAGERLPSLLTPRGAAPTVATTWRERLGWTESVRSDGHTRFSMIRGGSYFRAQGSVWYVPGGPQPCTSHAKFLLLCPGLDRCRTIGFRCVKEAESLPFRSEITSRRSSGTRCGRALPDRFPAARGQFSQWPGVAPRSWLTNAYSKSKLEWPIRPLAHAPPARR